MCDSSWGRKVKNFVQHCDNRMPHLNFTNKENVLHPIPEAAAQKGKAKGPPKKAKWTASDDSVLLDVLKAQQAAGNQANNNWKKCVWTAAETALAGSEKVSGGTPKKAKGCNDHWNAVRAL